MPLTALVLLSALLHAGWNALVKTGRDVLATQALVVGAAALVSLAGLAVVEPPRAASWPWLAASAVLHVAYSCFLVLGYRTGDLSLVYPIARGASPPLIGLGAWLIAGERLQPPVLLGVTLVSLGIAGIAGTGARADHVSRRAVLFALATGATIAGYSVCDGLGVRRAESVLGYLCWLNVLDGGAVLALTAVRRRGRLLDAFSPVLVRGVLGGLVSALAYGIVVWVMLHAPLAAVSALREVSVLFAAAIGVLGLGEPFGRRRIAGAALVAAGVALIRF